MPAVIQELDLPVLNERMAPALRMARIAEQRRGEGRSVHRVVPGPAVISSDRERVSVLAARAEEPKLLDLGWRVVLGVGVAVELGGHDRNIAGIFGAYLHAPRAASCTLASAQRGPWPRIARATPGYEDR